MDCKRIVDDFKRSIDSKNIEAMLNFVALADVVAEKFENTEIESELHTLDIDGCCSEAMNHLNRWYAKLKKNSKVDVLHNNCWYSSVVVAPVDRNGAITVAVGDVTLPPITNVKFLAPHETRLIASVSENAAEESTPPVDTADFEKSNIDSASTAEENPPPVLVTSRSGRKVKSTVLFGHVVSTVKNGETKPITKKRKKANATDGLCDTNALEDNNDWLCGICGMFEGDAYVDKLLLCDGPCLRSFHMGCLDMTELPEGDWLCEECSSGFHTCFICHEQAVENDDREMRKCKVAKCGKYYHVQCLSNSQFAYELTTKTVKKKAAPVSSSPSPAASATASGNGRKRSIETEEEEEEEECSFLCPSHACDTCYGFYRTMSNNLQKCIHCPRAYHANCIPPSARFNDLCVICKDHPNTVLPSKNASKSIISSDTDGVKYQLFWDQFICPPVEPREDNLADLGHFMLHTNLKKEVESHPPDFKLVWRLQYDSFSRTLPLINLDGEVCGCVGACGDRCMNRILKVECCGNDRSTGKLKATCGLKDCNVDCGNRLFENKQYAKVQRFVEEGRGHGLRALEEIKQGNLVIEYVGDVIDQETMQMRMENQTRLTPNDKDFYIMELENGVFVDGKFRGNNSRFINHSCAPNCELVRWIVKGRTRIGIFALRSISPMEPLSYDYQFDTKESSSFRCFCGAPECRGTMAPTTQPSQDDILASVSSMSRSERQKMLQVAAKTEEKEQKTILKLLARGKNSAPVEIKATSCTSEHLPGDAMFEVRNGAIRHTFGTARAAKLFLVKNTRKTSNWIARWQMYGRNSRLKTMDSNRNGSVVTFSPSNRRAPGTRPLSESNWWKGKL